MNEVTVSIKVGEAKIAAIGGATSIQLQIHNGHSVFAVDLDYRACETFRAMLNNLMQPIESNHYASQCIPLKDPNYEMLKEIHAAVTTPPQE